MLNELSQVVAAMDTIGIVGARRHQHIQPMGKNDDVLIVSVDEGAEPLIIEVVRAEIAQNLLKFAPANNGPSFPGFNVPAPLRTLDRVPVEELLRAIEALLSLRKNKNAPLAALKDATARLYKLSAPRDFAESQKNQFHRSCGEMVVQLREKLSSAPNGLSNFQRLLSLVEAAKPSLPKFAELLAEKLVNHGSEHDRFSLLLFQQVLFGVLDWKKRTAPFGSPDYWEEKGKQDKQPKYARQSIYFDLAALDPGYRVACTGTGELINESLLEADATLRQGRNERGVFGVDAFSGNTVELQDKFPSPKVVELGPVKLFSVNTNEVRALHRYGLGGSEAFPVSSALTERMGDALLYLASEKKRGSTCRAIPSAQAGKRDLLITYLEGIPEDGEQLAEMFGGEAESFSDADFSAIAKPVIKMLEGILATNANLNIQLIAFSSLDPGRRQVSFNRRFRVQDVIQAATNWEAGARNTPDVSVWFYDKIVKQSVLRSRTVPCPLELASVINRVWSSETEGGFSSKYQRAISVADAYDVFFADSPLARQKSAIALGLLIGRMSSLLVTVGDSKNRREWTRKNKPTLSDAVRWQSVKTIAFLGILLHQLGQQRKDFMQEPITQVGRLLALADSLHLQYCRHIRDGRAPSQLIGNALFNTALDQPVFALARLAERLIPYQAWARTFQSNDPDAGVGLVKYFLGEIAVCTAAISLDELPKRTSDADKAKLLLGYLADHPKNDTQEQ